jgi:hypothetical protein
MTGIGVVATGFYGLTEEITDDQYLTVTQLVYDHAPAEQVEKLLLALGLCMPVIYPEEPLDDPTCGGLLCDKGLHEWVPSNQVKKKWSDGLQCLQCRRATERSYKTQQRRRGK